MALTKRTRGYLPHWEAEGGTYSVTFHLGDSLPANVLASVSTRLINKVRGRRGSLWQCETYDHLIRDEAEFTHAVEYILDNARHAGLRGWPWVYVKGR
jgi:menaquinone-specific isochorismate synthase